MVPRPWLPRRRWRPEAGGTEMRTRRPFDLVLGALIVLSLGANGLLFTRWRATRPAKPAGDSTAQLAELDRLREEHTPAGERFQSAQPNRALTTAFIAALDRHIPLSGGSPV